MPNFLKIRVGKLKHNSNEEFKYEVFHYSFVCVSAQ